MWDFDYLTLLRDCADFVIIAVLCYWILYFIRGTRGANMLLGVVIFFCMGGILANLLNLPVLGYLFSRIWTILGVAIVIIFQEELRRIFAQAGGVFSSRNQVEKQTIDEIADAMGKMSLAKTGALIVIERKIGLAGIINSSVKLDAKVHSLLLQSLFFKNSPLHDCAVIIRGNKIVAANAVLPLAQYTGRMGTRHRAANGITEETDAIALVVSEETGSISIAAKGRIVRDNKPSQLAEELNILLIDESENKLLSLFKNSNNTTPESVDLFNYNETQDNTEKKS